MTRTRAPDLRQLLTRSMGDEPSRAPGRALSLAVDHRLPLEVTAHALGLTEDPLWSVAIAGERALREVRSATRDVLERALGPVLPAVAIEGMPWRPMVGTDVDLLVPPRLFAEVRDRLIGAGLVEVGWHTGPGRVGLARLGTGDSVDLVDVETAAESDFAPAEGEGIGPEEAVGHARLRPEVVRDRLCRAVAARQVVRLRDLADADALGLFSAPHPAAGPAARGWDLLRGAADGGLPAPPSTPRDSRRRRLAGRVRLVARLPGALLRGRSVRILVAGPSARRRTEELAADLHRLAIEVLLLDDPRGGSYLRAVLQGMTGDAVVVTAVEQPSAGERRFPRATLTADPADGRQELLRQALRLLTA